VEGQSLNHLIRIPPFGLWGEIGGHLGNWYKQQKRGGNFWFLSPSYLLFMDYILRMSFHIRKQGSTLNMPITAIEITKLFCGHRIRHCFRPKCFIYKTFFSKSQVENRRLELLTSALQRPRSTNWANSPGRHTWNRTRNTILEESGYVHLTMCP
jgi:hypothetical protein